MSIFSRIFGRKKYKPIFLHNSLSKNKEELKAISSPSVKVYTCGPTVYQKAHIGNLRSYVFADTLRRTIIHSGYVPHYVINITDVGHLTSDQDEGEDKIEKSARENNQQVSDLVIRITNEFFNDLNALNIPTGCFTFPRATEYIDEQIEFIKKIEAKGLTYRLDDGIYFDTSKYSGYGAFGTIPETEYSRLENAKSVKRNHQDFALWRLSDVGAPQRQQEWESPWGVGFPGWHIECSTMANAILDDLDIHTGGVDHLLVHHNNEIAQTKAAIDRDLAKVWLHNEFLTVNEQKISKSEGNTIYISDLIEKKYSPISYRYLLLTAHYKSKLNFSFKSLDAAQSALHRLIEFLVTTEGVGKPIEKVIDNASNFIRDDINTPGVISVMWDMVRNSEYSDGDKKVTVFKLDELLGLNLEASANAQIPNEIKEMISERDICRQSKDWKQADKIRENIYTQGFHIKDTEKGTIAIPR